MNILQIFLSVIVVITVLCLVNAVFVSIRNVVVCKIHRVSGNFDEGKFGEFGQST